MPRVSPIAGTVGVGFLLACTGGSSGVPLLGGPSDYATRLGEHLAGEHGVPCAVHGAGDTAVIGDWEIRLGDATIVDAENRSPWIENRDERAIYSEEGVRALVVPIERRNTTPVMLEDTLSYTLRFTDGSDAKASPYNTRLHAAAAGVEDPWEAAEAPADVWVKTAYVFPVRPGQADGAVLYVVASERIPNDRGRKVDTIVAQALIDVGRATEGTSLKQP